MNSKFKDWVVNAVELPFIRQFSDPTLLLQRVSVLLSEWKELYLHETAQFVDIGPNDAQEITDALWGRLAREQA